MGCGWVLEVWGSILGFKWVLDGIWVLVVDLGFTGGEKQEDNVLDWI